MTRRSDGSRLACHFFGSVNKEAVSPLAALDILVAYSAHLMDPPQQASDGKSDYCVT